MASGAYTRGAEIGCSAPGPAWLRALCVRWRLVALRRAPTALRFGSPLCHDRCIHSPPTLTLKNLAPHAPLRSARAVDLENFVPDKMREGGMALFIMATYGEGAS